jgi:hypothetical protein
MNLKMGKTLCHAFHYFPIFSNKNNFQFEMFSGFLVLIISGQGNRYHNFSRKAKTKIKGP